MYVSLQTRPTLNVKSAQAIGISILLIGLMLPGTAIANIFTVKPFTSLVVISLGTDIAINHATDQIRLEIPSAAFITVGTEDQLRAITRMSVREIIYVGHGLPQGLEIGSSLISWREVQAIVKESPSQQQLFAACYSLLAQVPGKQVFGFKGLVDVDEAAMWVTSAYYSLENQVSKIPQLLTYFFTILVAKVVNPAGQLLAFLGPTSTQPSPNIISCLMPRPMCGGGGGGGPPPLPTRYTIGSLINGYCVAQIQNIWHVHFNTLATNTVFYTHPDVYVYYNWIGYDTSAGLTGNNLVAIHLTKSLLLVADISTIASTILASAAVGAALGSIVPGIGTAIGALVGAIIGVLGAILQVVIIDAYIKDETQAGWGWLQNWYNQWYGVGADIKLGGLGWFRMGETFGLPFAYPLWYGGQNLGLGGW